MDDRPRVCVSIGGMKLITLVDSGASVTLLRLIEFERYCNRTHRSPFLRVGPRLCGVGTALDVHGTTEVLRDGVRRTWHDGSVGGRSDATSGCSCGKWH